MTCQFAGLLEKKITYHETIDGKMQEVRGALTKKRTYHERIATETAKLDELEQNAVNKELLTRLKQLVFLNESLKTQEAQFKANCQQQRAQLLQMIKELEEGEGDAEVVRISEVYKLCEADQAKLQKAREVHEKLSFLIRENVCEKGKSETTDCLCRSWRPRIKRSLRSPVPLTKRPPDRSCCSTSDGSLSCTSSSKTNSWKRASITKSTTP